MLREILERLFRVNHREFIQIEHESAPGPHLAAEQVHTCECELTVTQFLASRKEPMPPHQLHRPHASFTGRLAFQAVVRVKPQGARHAPARAR